MVYVLRARATVMSPPHACARHALRRLARAGSRCDKLKKRLKQRLKKQPTKRLLKVTPSYMQARSLGLPSPPKPPCTL